MKKVTIYFKLTYFFQKTLRNPLKIHIRFTQNWYYIITAEDTKKALVIGKT